MNTNDDNREKDAAKGEPVPLQPIIDMGSTVVKNSRGTVYCLTIVGQVEGHTLLPDNTKTTKYEHVLPLLAALVTPSACRWQCAARRRSSRPPRL